MASFSSRYIVPGLRPVFRHSSPDRDWRPPFNPTYQPFRAHRRTDTFGNSLENLPLGPVLPPNNFQDLPPSSAPREPRQRDVFSGNYPRPPSPTTPCPPSRPVPHPFPRPLPRRRPRPPLALPAASDNIGTPMQNLRVEIPANPALPPTLSSSRQTQPLSFELPPLDYPPLIRKRKSPDEDHDDQDVSHGPDEIDPNSAKGRKACSHLVGCTETNPSTCQPERGFKSSASGSWREHVRSKLRHPNCTEACPAHRLLATPRKRQRARKKVPAPDVRSNSEEVTSIPTEPSIPQSVIEISAPSAFAASLSIVPELHILSSPSQSPLSPLTSLAPSPPPSSSSYSTTIETDPIQDVQSVVPTTLPSYSHLPPLEPLWANSEDSASAAQYTIALVPEPTFAFSNVEEVDNNASFYITEIEWDTLSNDLQASLSDSVKVLGPGSSPRYSRVLIHEYAHVFLLLPSSIFAKRVIPWSIFSEAVGRRDWHIFANIHIIIQTSFCENIWSKAYGFKHHKKLLEFESNLFYLEQRVKCIPSSAETRAHAYKLPTVLLLDEIARQVTHTKRPRTIPVSVNSDLNAYAGKYVLKRSHSSGGDHVSLINKEEEINWDSKPGTLHFVQEYVHCLSLGEIRVGVVDGHTIAFRVFTQASDDGGWQYFPWDAPVSLATLFDRKGSNVTSITVEDLDAGDDAPLSDTAATLEHLDQFVLTNLRHLIAFEKEKFGSTTLGIFARIDISIIFNEEAQQYQYFVNEVERLPGGCLWVLDLASESDATSSSMIDGRAAAVAKSLTQYLQSLPRRSLTYQVENLWWMCG